MKIKKIYLLMQQLRYLTKLISLFLHVHNVYVISLNRAFPQFLKLMEKLSIIIEKLSPFNLFFH